MTTRYGGRIYKYNGYKRTVTTIPVKLGRNLAVIVEVASMNNRQKRMGYNAAVELNNRLMSQMESQLGNL